MSKSKVKSGKKSASDYQRFPLSWAEVEQADAREQIADASDDELSKLLSMVIMKMIVEASNGEFFDNTDLIGLNLLTTEMLRRAHK